MKLKFLLFLFTFFAALKVFSQEIIPNEFETVNLTYEKDGQIINESFDAPKTTNQVLFEADFIERSPRDPSRDLRNIPNFGLALFHHWLFGEVILRNAQIQYAICVGEVKGEERRLKIKSSINNNPNVMNVLGYHVPFLAVQNLADRNFPPRKEDAIEHTFAAIDTINIIVSNLKACEKYKNILIKRKR